MCSWLAGCWLAAWLAGWLVGWLLAAGCWCGLVVPVGTGNVALHSAGHVD